MYFDIVKSVLDAGIARYGSDNSMTRDNVCDAIRSHIERTSEEHYKDEPNIEYINPLCRLGYLYVHTAANATLFERALADSSELRQRIQSRSGNRLGICAVGGGPGTEMLGLVKHLATYPYIPSRVDFTVLDGVPQWSESWMMLAKEAEAELAQLAQRVGCPPPPIAPMFLPMDVMNAASYQNYGFAFGAVDIIVMNYLLSENKTRLAAFHPALQFMVSRATAGTLLVFIDRKEYAPGTTFLPNIRWLTQNSGLEVIEEIEFGKTLDRDEQASDLDDYLDKFKRLPRVKFWDSWQRRPTAFAIICRKP